MQRRQYLRWGLGLAGSVLSGQLGAQATDFQTGVQADLLASFKPEKLVWRERVLVGFGTTLWIKAGHDNPDQLEAALTAAVSAIRKVERQMSLFDPDSALSQLNRTGSLHQPDSQLLTVLNLSSQISQRSGGAFDISMQPLWQVWSQAAAESRLPSKRAIERAQRLVNWRAVETTASQVRINQRGMGLSLNGIAQGYASDLARATLQAHGIRHALIDAGETALLGEGPDAKPWRFDIESAAIASKMVKSNAAPTTDTGRHGRQQSPTVVISDGRAMATSSDAHTVFSPDHIHHHILNPLTGFSPLYWSSVTVIADSCVLADALTKVFFMLPQHRIRSAARFWNVDVVLQNKKAQWISTLVG